MRKKWEQQMPLMLPKIDHPQADELEAISRIINGKPTICNHVMQNLCKGHPTVKWRTRYERRSGPACGHC